ncbi:MAG: hypothetical protein MZV64_49805 [Ignavibacteriales bacterium]|nr:hypothetical protein [Ignavibacteriales bacterium]
MSSRTSRGLFPDGFLDELEGVVDPFRDPARRDVEGPGDLFARELLVIIEVEHVAELGLEAGDHLLHLLGPLAVLHLVVGVGVGDGLGRVLEDPGLLADVVDDPPAGDGVEEGPDRGVAAELAALDLGHGLGQDLVDDVLPVGVGAAEGLADPEGDDRAVLQDGILGAGGLVLFDHPAQSSRSLSPPPARLRICSLKNSLRSMRISRGLLPSLGPMRPASSIWSMIRAARA